MTFPRASTSATNFSLSILEKPTKKLICPTLFSLSTSDQPSEEFSSPPTLSLSLPDKSPLSSHSLISLSSPNELPKKPNSPNHLSPSPLCKNPHSPNPISPTPPDKILRETAYPNPFYLCTLLKKCTTFKALQQIHGHLFRNHLHQSNFYATLLVGYCSSIRRAQYAKLVFYQVSYPNIYLWNSIIKAYCESCSLKETIFLYTQLQRSNTKPDNYTFPSLLKACANEPSLQIGEIIHSTIVKRGIESDLFVQTGLIDIYGKCFNMQCACKVFDKMTTKSIVSWTAMIVGYSSSGNMVMARNLFDQMPERNLVSYNAIISGYVKSGDLSNACELFNEMPEKNMVSFTTMIDGYSKSGDMPSARFLFDQLAQRDVFLWSALISGYAQNGQPNEAVKLFVEMQTKSEKPDEHIMVSVMSACAQLGSLSLAKWVDGFIYANKMEVGRAQMIASLIDMHSKCGNLERAYEIFGGLLERELVCYSSMIHGLSIHGHGQKAIKLFSQMLNEGIKPDGVVFIVALSACSREGMVDQGRRFFKQMSEKYQIFPSSDHYAIMVDLFGRAGRLEEAYELMKTMPIQPNVGAWGALLGACRLQGHIELGEMVAKRLFDIEPHNGGNYVLLSNIYAAANRWADVWCVREMMRERGVRKIPGCSWL
ncbi:hypothetical protein AMTRI_Chr11g157330 [Amborella trichopoda]|uniref:putative pentatricopeptide repeat-containing protein At5g37570 n=1 Tax=Amborella trichopoda TaxID=13333 RepID=UPI0009BDF5E1|nr:putative pentatricopeptide repeat-containing protein At5g37570 [Amborella trichopoda]XP_020531745.1 putative pentatricopeptide repeat-containing protein At5g37570 [Amborella trichopoda]XP_020531746.1 putative pentatricopeptide repeat-containing protein At5g37570 [Amborella trichopoda]XP_020531747.1 putative pentatricopeptide repeat-containing protein At5g37570 [Amborella trichopoda]XP_020531748.1 putative pentatricopeptide repeat-containing protein At5g37570 [Amborella trichopoda]XP_0205317|eukprot:XP_011628634.2 putative pentatricopeptide repeat-containing protein At5g37570 [Amborella trichopoda]